jgi:signal transduction histidine kinase
MTDIAPFEIAPPKPKPAPPEKPARRKRGTLLVVDDEEGPRASLRFVFKDDYEVLTAADGASALELIQQHNVDVAILDIRMPGMSGVELLERIKFIDSTIEAVMLTAFETTETIRQALKLRACDYLNKPYDLAALRAAVNSAMQRRTLDTEILNNNEKLQKLSDDLQQQRLENQLTQARNDIYASIIHDINGPLTVISGFIELINQRIGNAERLDAEELRFVKDRLRTMTRQVTNCVEISRRYLSFLRKQPADASLVGVNQVFTDLNHLVRVHPSRQQHEFEVQPLARDCALRMNGTDVIQLLLNLIVNAFQAAPQPHAVWVSGERLESPLNLAALKDSPEERWLNVESFQNAAPLVKLCVRDNGPGISPEILPKIFQAYFTTKDARQGTGLGLNIVQRFVREGGGILHIQTTPGEGTSFTVILPACEMIA